MMGKSTIAYQFAKQFLSSWENGLVVYFDVESNSGEVETSDGGSADEEISATVFQESRAETFKLVGERRFKYSRRPFNIRQFFEYVDDLVGKKREIQSKTGSEVKILFILDSLAALSYSRIENVEEFDENFIE